MTKSILIVEDEESIRDALAELFGVESNDISTADTLADALHLLSRRSFDLIVTDIRLGARPDGGLQVMGAAGMLSPEAVVIALTAYPHDGNRDASTRLGATYFLEKPADLLRLASLATHHGVATTLIPATDR